MSDDAFARTGQKRRRTKSGCLNCRRKRKKCDEARPRCAKCERSSEKCQYEAFIKFRPPTGLPGSRESTPSGPITLRIESDSEETVLSSAGPSAGFSAANTCHRSGRTDVRDEDNDVVHVARRLSDPDERTGSLQHRSSVESDNRCSHWEPADATPSERICHPTVNICSARYENDTIAAETRQSARQSGIAEEGDLSQDNDPPNSQSSTEDNVQESQLQDDDARYRADETWTAQDLPSLVDMVPMNVNMLPDHVLSPSVSSGYYIEDGIFEPGSAYQNLFQSLRSHVFRTAQFENEVPARMRTSGGENNQNATSPGNVYDVSGAVITGEAPTCDNVTVSHTFHLPPAQEYLLWKAWTEEVSIWLDKFDPQTHFRDTFPIIAKGRPHLKYAMLSLSARYLESRDRSVPQSLTLALYQHTIQLLLPQLYMRDIAVIASCSILCVLEMFSCSPKAWRRHLDGCASLMQSLDIRGDAGGAEEAVFWCFARMDICGGLISLERTLIPVDKWTRDSITEVTVKTYPRSGAFQDYAKMASNIIARAMDLFASYHASEGAFGFSAADPLRSHAYGKRWQRLFDDIEDWFSTRPKEMLPIMAMSAKDCGSPFPTVLYSNAAAISGNQFAHTAAILMLQRKPRDRSLGKVRSILWHARQICGIALSNDHHGAWTNTVQPIWIAGRLMSHPQEHDAIVCLLKRIERETGWATQWRIDDLMEHWGDADD